MSIIAKWNDKTWQVSPESIIDLKGLSFTFAELADNNTSTEGETMTNQRGLDAFKMSFSSTLHSGAGVNVRKEIESWKEEVTKTAQFYLNGKKLGPKVRLDKVAVSNIQTDNRGRMLVATLQFTFVENAPKRQQATASSAQNVTATEEDKKELGNGNIEGVETGIKPGSYVRPLGTKDLDGNIVNPNNPLQVGKLDKDTVETADKKLRFKLTELTLLK